MASRVELAPVPAITGTRLRVSSTTILIMRMCSSTETVGDSPVVPTGTNPSIPHESARRPGGAGLLVDGIAAKWWTSAVMTPLNIGGNLARLGPAGEPRWALATRPSPRLCAPAPLPRQAGSLDDDGVACVQTLVMTASAAVRSTSTTLRTSARPVGATSKTRSPSPTRDRAEAGSRECVGKTRTQQTHHLTSRCPAASGGSSITT